MPAGRSHDGSAGVIVALVGHVGSRTPSGSLPCRRVIPMNVVTEVRPAFSVGGDWIARGAKVTTTQYRLHLASLRETDAASLKPTIVRCGAVPPCRHASSTRDVAGAATKKLRARSSGRGLIRDAAGCGFLRLAVRRALVVIAPDHAQSYMEASIRAMTAAIRLGRGVVPARVP